jgi:hypothetical protein
MERGTAEDRESLFPLNVDKIHDRSPTRTPPSAFDSTASTLAPSLDAAVNMVATPRTSVSAMPARPPARPIHPTDDCPGRVSPKRPVQAVCNSAQRRVLNWGRLEVSVLWQGSRTYAHDASPCSHSVASGDHPAKDWGEW